MKSSIETFQKSSILHWFMKRIYYSRPWRLIRSRPSYIDLWKEYIKVVHGDISEVVHLTLIYDKNILQSSMETLQKSSISHWFMKRIYYSCPWRLFRSRPSYIDLWKEYIKVVHGDTSEVVYLTLIYEKNILKSPMETLQKSSISHWFMKRIY